MLMSTAATDIIDQIDAGCQLADLNLQLGLGSSQERVLRGNNIHVAIDPVSVSCDRQGNIMLRGGSRTVLLGKLLRQNM